MDHELSVQRAINQIVNQNSAERNSANLESRIGIGSNEIVDFDAKLNGSTLNEAAKVKEAEKGLSCLIDVKCNDNGSFAGENERICRICHLSEKESEKNTVELMEIGCGCKGELGVAHSQCAEAWFKVKGHRVCEICGETATNITGISDNRFMEEWNGRGSTDTSTNSSDSSGRCLSGQPLCNFLMACLVIAFILPWFFRVNML